MYQRHACAHNKICKSLGVGAVDILPFVASGRNNNLMIPQIVQLATQMTLLGAGPVVDSALAQALDSAPVLVAADGGADHALAMGRLPDLAVGDLDSISAQARARLGLARLHRIAEQDSTDFEKALMVCPAPRVLALGFSGGRLDHELAVFHGLLRFAHRQLVVLGQEDAVFLAPPRINLDVPAGTRVSLFPMGPCHGESQGLEWPINGIEFAPGERIGTSNRATGRVELGMNAPRMLMITPLSQLDAVLRALDTAQPWPCVAQA
jgi:thiamine pyrophosphokinase